MRALLASALLLTGCAEATPDSTAVTAEEDRQLNDAAAALETNAAAPQEDDAP